MCGRYYVDDEMYQEIELLTGKIDREQRLLGKTDIYPSSMAPMLTASGGAWRCENQRWGFPGFSSSGVVFNARSESALEKRMFSESVRKRRAVIPAAGFYEWNRKKEKAVFFPVDSRVLYLAGFYREFPDSKRYVILTTEANESMRPVHDRMPLILRPAEAERWIMEDTAAEELLKLTPPPLEREMEYEQQTLF